MSVVTTYLITENCNHPQAWALDSYFQCASHWLTGCNPPELLIFVKVKYHIYCSVYAFLNHSVCVKCAVFIRFFFFYMPLMTFWVVPKSCFSYKPCGHHCGALQGTVIFRRAVWQQNWLYSRTQHDTGEIIQWVSVDTEEAKGWVRGLSNLNRWRRGVASKGPIWWDGRKPSRPWHSGSQVKKVFQGRPSQPYPLWQRDEESRGLAEKWPLSLVMWRSDWFW